MEKCKKALTLYRAKDYKRDFGFIDYISAVRRRDLLEQLDALAFSELRKPRLMMQKALSPTNRRRSRTHVRVAAAA